MGFDHFGDAHKIDAILGDRGGHENALIRLEGDERAATLSPAPRNR
jgi:hypothetical protein